MRHQALCAVALLVLLSSSAFAGPVSYGTGSIVVTYHDTFAGDDTESFTVTAPGSATERYDGTALDPEVPGIGDERGNSGATYAIVDLANGATFDATIFHSNEGDTQRTAGGAVDFVIAFTTSQPLNYVWNIQPNGANTLTASLDQTVEGLEIDVFGNGTGSLWGEGGPTDKTLQGTLPAGAHTLGISFDIFNGRSQNGVGPTEASISLQLTADDGPGTAIPLPPAVWSGLMTLASAGLLLKRRT